MPKYGSWIGSYDIRDPCYGKVWSKIRGCWCDLSAHSLNIIIAIFDKFQICPRCVLPLFHPIWGSIESSQKPLSIYPTCVLAHLLILEIFTFSSLLSLCHPSHSSPLSVLCTPFVLVKPHWPSCSVYPHVFLSLELLPGIFLAIPQFYSSIYKNILIIHVWFRFRTCVTLNLWVDSGFREFSEPNQRFGSQFSKICCDPDQPELWHHYYRIPGGILHRTKNRTHTCHLMSHTNKSFLPHISKSSI